MEHSYTELRTRIQSKIDDLSNWLSTDIILLDGELAIVRLSGENDVRAKAGNGKDHFSELPYLNQSQLEELCSSLLLKISSDTTLSGVAYQTESAFQLGSQSDKLLAPISCLYDLKEDVKTLSGSLSNYVPLSGDSLVSNDLSVGSNLYVNGEILSSIISAYAPKIIFRQYFEE